MAVLKVSAIGRFHSQVVWVLINVSYSCHLFIMPNELFLYSETLLIEFLALIAMNIINILLANIMTIVVMNSIVIFYIHTYYVMHYNADCYYDI